MERGSNTENTRTRNTVLGAAKCVPVVSRAFVFVENAPDAIFGNSWIAKDEMGCIEMTDRQMDDDTSAFILSHQFPSVITLPSISCISQ